MNDNQPTGYLVIPIFIDMDERLTSTEKRLYGYITNLANLHGYSYASRGYYAHILGTSERVISRGISKLHSLGYIRRDETKTPKGTKVKIYLTHTPKMARADETKMARAHTPKMARAYKEEKEKYLEYAKTPLTPQGDDASVLEAFENFLDAYKKRVNRKKAFDAFKRLKIDEWDTCIEHAKKFRKNHESAQKLDFQPHAATYINQKRWLDDELPYKTSAKNIGHNTTRKDF